MTTTPAMPEPFAWAWHNKVTGAKGVYFEDPKPFGITSHPDYEWTNLYTEAQPLATLQAQPAEVSDAEIVATLEAAGVKFQRFMGGITGTKDCWSTAGSQDVRKLLAGVRAILALRPQSESEQEKELRRSLAEAQATISERNAEIIELQKRIRRSPQAVPMMDEQRRTLVGNYFADEWAKRAAHLLLSDYDKHHGITAPAGQPKE